jgi:UDP-N-acetyl-D-mannosaminuronic acid dehydrogenase
MQLAAAYENHFALGHAAMLVNEGLPNFIVRHLKGKYPLSTLGVGILGMAFKADSDDPRESLSYKLRKILEYEAREVLCTDPHIEDPSFLPLDDVLGRADILIIGAPHREYRALGPAVAKPVIDIWNLFGKGAALT